MDRDIGRTANARLASPMEDVWLESVRPTIKAGANYMSRVCRSAWRDGYKHGQLSLCERLRHEAEALPRERAAEKFWLEKAADHIEGMQQ